MPLISVSSEITITIPVALDSVLMDNYKFDDYKIDDELNHTVVKCDMDSAQHTYSNLKDIVGFMCKADPTNRMLNRLNSELAQIVEHNREEWRARR